MVKHSCCAVVRTTEWINMCWAQNVVQIDVSYLQIGGWGGGGGGVLGGEKGKKLASLPVQQAEGCSDYAHQIQYQRNSTTPTLTGALEIQDLKCNKRQVKDTPIIIGCYIIHTPQM